MLTKARISREAKKIRHRIIRDIEQLKKGPSGKTEEEQLKSLEENMAQYVRPLLARRQKMSHAENSRAYRPCAQFAQESIGRSCTPTRCWACPWGSLLQASAVWSRLTVGKLDLRVASVVDIVVLTVTIIPDTVLDFGCASSAPLPRTPSTSTSWRQRT